MWILALLGRIYWVWEWDWEIGLDYIIDSLLYYLLSNLADYLFIYYYIHYCIYIIHSYCLSKTLLLYIIYWSSSLIDLFILLYSYYVSPIILNVWRFFTIGFGVNYLFIYWLGCDGLIKGSQFSYRVDHPSEFNIVLRII